MVYQKKAGEATKDATGTFQVKQGAKTLVYKKKDSNGESPVPFAKNELENEEDLMKD